MLVSNYLFSQDLPSYVPTDGLIAYYPFNGNANDESGNGNHGTVNGATLTSDRDGNENSSYSFDGVSSSISTVGNFNFNNELTFSSWIYIESYIEDGVHERIVNSSEGTGGIQDRWMFNVSPNSESSTLEFNIGYTGNEVQGLKTIPLNKFTHVAFTFKNGEVVIYMDGEIDSSSTLGITNLNFINSPIDLGSVNGLESFFNGELDDIGIWNRALSEQEIQNLYNSSSGDILLNGTVSAENHQIKNVSDPTHSQDVTTKNYVDSLLDRIEQLENQVNNDGSTVKLSNEVRYIAYDNEQFLEIKNTGTLYNNLSWSQSGTTVTITSKNHGLSSGDYIVVRGGVDVYLYTRITYINSDSFTYISNTSGTVTGTDGAYIPAVGVSSISDEQVTIDVPNTSNIQIGYIKYISSSFKSSNFFSLNLPQGITNGVGGNSSFETQSPPTSIVFDGNGTYNSSATIQIKGTNGSGFNEIIISAGLSTFTKNMIIFTF